MDHVVWTNRPSLRHPVLIAAFEGWNDAGDAASFAARYLADRWDATEVATIDPEEFYDFTSVRPHVRLEDSHRTIDWPLNRLSAATVPDAELDVLVLSGTEPQLRWRTFCAEVVDMAEAMNVSLVVLLGALLADVPHTRPVTVVGTADDPELVTRLNLQRSRYEGPTGIVGVLHDAFRRASVPATSLWAAVPTYVPGAPSPKAALALIERAAELLSVPVSTTDLEIASASYERQIDDLVSADEDTAAYVARLEQSVDEGEEDDDEDVDFDEGVATEPADPTRLIEEVERFLRDQPPGV